MAWFGSRVLLGLVHHLSAFSFCSIIMLLQSYVVNEITESVLSMFIFVTLHNYDMGSFGIFFHAWYFLCIPLAWVCRQNLLLSLQFFE